MTLHPNICILEKLSVQMILGDIVQVTSIVCYQKEIVLSFSVANDGKWVMGKVYDQIKLIYGFNVKNGIFTYVELRIETEGVKETWIQ